MKDRDSYWSHTTLIMAMVISFAIGFTTCHLVYTGFNKGGIHGLH